MTGANVKPGTRCECDHRFDGELDPFNKKRDHEWAHRVNEYSLLEKCPRDAVRMVTVPFPETAKQARLAKRAGSSTIKATRYAMCAPCAAWQESRQGQSVPHIRVGVVRRGHRINDRGDAGRTLCGAPITDRDHLITDRNQPYAGTCPDCVRAYESRQVAR